jgi:hypothetical protein
MCLCSVRAEGHAVVVVFWQAPVCGQWMAIEAITCSAETCCKCAGALYCTQSTPMPLVSFSPLIACMPQHLHTPTLQAATFLPPPPCCQ